MLSSLLCVRVSVLHRLECSESVSCNRALGTAGDGREEAGERPLLALAIGIAIGSVSAALLAVRIRASCSLLALHSHRSPHKIAE